MAIAVCAVSSSAVLVRLAPGADPLALGFWRTLGVGLLLCPWIRPMASRDFRLALLAGAFLALHFWSWFSSLQHTTVLRSTLLVCLNPVWLGIAEWSLLKKAPSGRFWIGIGIGLAGVALMGSAGTGGATTIRGDLLALLGGLFGSAYLFLGRSVRQRIGIAPYASVVSLSAAMVLLPCALATSAELTGFSSTTWLAILGLTLGPQLLGHSGFNYSLRYLPASLVSAAILLEPLGATLLAASVLGEKPGSMDVAGGVLLLCGVLVATVQSRMDKPHPALPEHTGDRHDPDTNRPSFPPDVGDS